MGVVVPVIRTVKHQIAWSYANLARAHAALDQGCQRYTRSHHIIRSRLFHGLVSGRMSMRSLYEDERLKLVLPHACAYCGSLDRLCLDHLIPRIKGGPDDADNILWACRSCNGSKHGRDLLRWMQVRGGFPSLFVLRRYLKLIWARSDALALLDTEIEDALVLALPFSLALLPQAFPPLDQLCLWVRPAGEVVATE